MERISTLGAIRVAPDEPVTLYDDGTHAVY